MTTDAISCITSVINPWVVLVWWVVSPTLGLLSPSLVLGTAGANYGVYPAWPGRWATLSTTAGASTGSYFGRHTGAGIEATGFDNRSQFCC